MQLSYSFLLVKMPRQMVSRPRGVTKRGKRRGNYKRRAESRKKTQRPSFNKRIDYPQLKHDVMLAGRHTSLTPVDEGLATISLPALGMRFTIWSPSYRVANDTGRERDRLKTNCLFVGVKEKALFAGEGNVLHRRIVFWSRVSVDQAMPFSGPDETMLRNIAQRDPETDRTLDPFLDGSRGVDYLPSTIWHQKFDKNVVDVVYDRDFTYVQHGTVLKTVKFWHRCEREISYEDKENGVGISRSGWSGRASGSGGNLYVVDFYVSRGTASATMNVSFSSEVYWRERNT